MLFTLVRTLKSVLQSQRALTLENLALHHQLTVLQRTAKRPRLRGTDRLLWILLSRVWRGWRDSLTIVQLETVIRWHRRGVQAVLEMEEPSRACWKAEDPEGDPRSQRSRRPHSASSTSSSSWATIGDRLSTSILPFGCLIQTSWNPRHGVAGAGAPGGSYALVRRRR